MYLLIVMAQNKILNFGSIGSGVWDVWPTKFCQFWCRPPFEPLSLNDQNGGQLVSTSLSHYRGSGYDSGHRPCCLKHVALRAMHRRLIEHSNLSLVVSVNGGLSVYPISTGIGSSAPATQAVQEMDGGREGAREAKLISLSVLLCTKTQFCDFIFLSTFFIITVMFII